MTGGDAGLAASAAVERDLEGVLFSGTGFAEGDELAVVRGEIGFGMLLLLVMLGKFCHGGLQGRLLGEELVDEGCGSRRTRGWHGRQSFQGGWHDSKVEGCALVEG